MACQWSHGTHCAGLAGAVTGNGTDTASLASGITLRGVRTSATSGTSMDCGIEGVIWAAEHGANVISVSYSGTYKSFVEEEVYRGCVEKGIVMVAAAGSLPTVAEYVPQENEVLNVQVNHKERTIKLITDEIFTVLRFTIYGE